MIPSDLPPPVPPPSEVSTSGCALSSGHTAADRVTWAKDHASSEGLLDRPEAFWQERLSPLEYQVAREGATEPPFRNRYWNHKQPGLYCAVGTDLPLFRSEDKYDSGTGWPSFSRPIAPEAVLERPDYSHGWVRMEVICARTGHHLGHVFPDGPPPEGRRYCINSAALTFLPRAESAATKETGDGNKARE